MGTNGRAWPLKLKERCEAVGWLVTMSKAGHYKVRTKRGRGFSFPSTPGDRRAELNAIAEAKRHGLEHLESKLARDNERDRQARIRRDRTSVGDALVNAAAASETELELKDEEGPIVEKEIAQKEGALGYVDGVAIAEKAPAFFKSPAPQMRGQKVKLTDVTELLLADGRVLYRCEKLGSWKDDIPENQPCHATFDSAQSARVHTTFHSRKDLPIAPGARKKAEREAAAATTRAQVAKAAAKKAPSKRAQAADSSPEDAGVVARMVALVEQFERFQDELEVMGKSAEELSAELKAVANALPDSVADEGVIEKARKYEELRKLIG